MKNNKVKYVVLYGVAILPLILTIIFYNKIPDQIPMHWNVKGDIDRYGAKFPNAFILSSLALFISLFMEITAKIDPKKKNYEVFRNSFYTIQLVTVLLLSSIYLITIITALGYDFISVDLVVKLMVGLLFVVMGNLMPKLKNNYFLGIRTPWTLASEEVWFKTHRVGGALWFVGGIVMMCLAFIKGPISAALYMGVVLVTSLTSVVYSYVVFLKISKNS